MSWFKKNKKIENIEELFTKKLISELKVINISKGDILVITTNSQLSEAHLQYCEKSFLEKFPEMEVLFLIESKLIAILRKDNPYIPKEYKEQLEKLEEVD